MSKSEAYQAFLKNVDSIKSLVRYADVYGLHALANARGEPVNTDVIQEIISQKGLSPLAISWQFCMTPEEYAEFGKRGHLRSICEHIIFASYVALEAYLIAKFNEYFTHKYSSIEVAPRAAFLKKITLRSLEEIKKHCVEFLEIRLAHFEPDPGVYEEAPWFHPGSSWEGLKILERCRNCLAHNGEMADVKIVMLVDAWSVAEFCERWVMLFECNYDDFIYNGIPTTLESLQPN